ncbi:MAG: bifunctional (p)ppGpp synthetase/guanosine-3',5'-bis(diphosphate) 3'-pyrophosphohydrolase [Lachnospiraceae bacterium]|nr:bifunctional (p)ppGpp synthetase/guanosine-3',5'-bis(diphosphate) 3'-pyrophosphohydrolase [Lachnospiraceae bacterium]MBR1450611.1 bifunctional (p)ppGpp synthetase/guanosine-3',5'-bis(diphosphate) 3'-pyrophosphohydrolase [Lachnospiraceae bacterium]
MDEGHVTELILDDGAFTALSEHQSPEQLYQELISRVRKYHPSDDISLIEKAYNLASMAHKNQLRKSGEPYIIHPLSVAIILAELQLDKETIVSGILHDVVEDTVITDEELRDQFGNYVALIVDGVTKLEKIRYNGDKLEYQAENLRKMFLAMAKDIRVIMVKLADRLHNMRTLQYQPPERQVEIARETMDIYAPLAQRLGISKMKVELDDLSLKYLEPEVYYDLADKISIRKSEREKYVSEIVEDVKKHITNAGIEATFDGRVKHFMSIYRKMLNQDKTLDQIYDLFAVRIIVNTIPDCYAALGVIHEMYKPIPGRFKDYIAMPKPNMYQSLHTTLIGPSGRPFEIQIRTKEMHRTAEYGIAAHWKYKESSDGKKVEESEAEKMSWLRQILDWQVNLSDNKEFLNTLKSDLELYSDTVYCFTPTGDVKTLPAGSNPIDFAYAIHSAVGNRMIGARVNGQLATINYKIQNGDRIEIITSQNSRGPSRDWLNLVKSNQAKTKINQWFKNELKEDNIQKGRELILGYCKSNSIDSAQIMTPQYMNAIMQKYGFRDWDAVCAAVGHGGLREGAIINRMKELYDRDHPIIMSDEKIVEDINVAGNHKRLMVRRGGGVAVQGTEDLAVRFSKCCSPIPGDEIVGYVTRGRGVSIHRTDCVNIIALPEDERARLIEAVWEREVRVSDNTEKFETGIRIFAQDRHGLLMDVTKNLTERGVSILNMNVRTSKQGTVTIELSFSTSGKEELTDVVQKLRAINGIIDIERTAG